VAVAYALVEINREVVPMRNVKIERLLAVDRSSVWAVLADYPNIADWNDGLKKSYAIGDATEGVGAQRQTELIPAGAMRETVTEWVPEERMVIAIDKIEKMPVKQATMTFTLSGGGATTLFTMSYDYELRGGPLAFILGPILDRQMNKGFNGFIDYLEPTAQAWTAP
jgi:uncharacterized protein YndB with AHSA1/START domain